MEEMNMPIETLGLANNICNPLKAGGIYTIGQLLPYTEDDLVKIRNIGSRVVLIDEAVNKAGYHLGVTEEEAEELGITAERENCLLNVQELDEIQKQIDSIKKANESLMGENYQKIIKLQELHNLIRSKQILETASLTLDENLENANIIIEEDYPEKPKHR